MMKTAVYGAGAMGTVLGAYLARAGVEADLVSRNGDHVAALQKGGARIRGWAAFSVPVRAIPPEEMEGRYGLVILLVKQQDNQAAVERITPFLAPEGVVLTLQNGIPETALAETLGEERVLGGIAIWGAALGEPGTAELTSDPRGMSFSIGVPWSGPAAAVLERRIPGVKALLETVCPVTVETNFTGLRWSKLLVNAAFSGLSAVSGMSFGEIARGRKSRNCALGIIGECIGVCRAAGVRLPAVQGRDIEKLLDPRGGLWSALRARILLPLAVRNHRRIKSGMLGDLDRGRKTEIDAINGEVSRWGTKYAVPVPLNNAVVDLVHAIERGERRRSPEHFALLWNHRRHR
ncbi:MAG: ketopantoate reductase family protein [Treponema sp.]|jgi:2-dehydropantoate 2-reductase|nr:ketopantoate reductase family protein [Treponema sp.]